MSDKMIEELKDFLSEHELVASCKAQEIANGCLEIIARHKATEPKDCGFTLTTCPYERCSGITMRDPKAEEMRDKWTHDFCRSYVEESGIIVAEQIVQFLMAAIKEQNKRFLK